MARSSSPQDKKDDPLLMAAGILTVVSIIVFVTWIYVGARVVYFLSMPLADLGQVWRFVGMGSYADEIARGGRYFWFHSTDIGLFRFLKFADAALRPYALMFAAWTVYAVVKTVRATLAGDVQRKLSPEQLLRSATGFFTGNIPIMHLREKIVNNQLPQWARQRQVVEIIKTERTIAGKPLLLDGDLAMDRLETWLQAIDPSKTASDGRLFSRHLGYQMVHFPEPAAGTPGAIAVRFSDEGKALFALFTAHAFGGNEGINDYQKAMDELNRSCVGHPLGCPNLSVANWIWHKYKANQMAHNLFLQHPWEYTYLLELLSLAKLKGKMGHWQFMWLKPLNRPLFYAINSLGRHTPHPEGAMAFGQHEYEKEAARLGNYPCIITKTEGEKGVVTHKAVPTIFSEEVLRGFERDWADWVNGEDDEYSWWADKNAWKAHTALAEALKPVAVPPEALKQEQELLARAAQAEQDRAAAEASGETSFDADDDSVSF